MRRRAATIDLGPWPFSDRPRVLIEHPDPDMGLELAGAIRRTGCSVGICRGPARTGRPPTRCPLHQLEACIAVESADLVVTVLDLGGEDGAGVLRGLRTRYPNTPLVVAATAAESLQFADLLEGCTVVPVDEQPDEIAGAVRNALAEREESAPSRRSDPAEIPTRR